MMDHSAVFVDVETRAVVQLKLATMVYNYPKVDWQATWEDMKNLRLPEGNTQQQWDSFEEKLHQMIDDHVPWKVKLTRQKNQDHEES